MHTSCCTVLFQVFSNKEMHYAPPSNVSGRTPEQSALILFQQTRIPSDVWQQNKLFLEFLDFIGFMSSQQQLSERTPLLGHKEEDWTRLVQWWHFHGFTTCTMDIKSFNWDRPDTWPLFGHSVSRSAHRGLRAGRLWLLTLLAVAHLLQWAMVSCAATQ